MKFDEIDFGQVFKRKVMEGSFVSVLIVRQQTYLACQTNQLTNHTLEYFVRVVPLMIHNGVYGILNEFLEFVGM